jgi:Fur family transcriptional regulator, peroxide stress response regulator
MNKKTRQREAIIRVLKDGNVHPTAEWVYNEVRKEIPHISLGTVYRNLHTLSGKGDIVELDMCGALSRFDTITQDHYHFRCINCGDLFDIKLPVNKDLNAQVENDTGFEVLYHRLEFRGLCMECQEGE